MLLTQSEVIERFRSFHGDTYIYDKTVYLGQHESVVVTCRTHGDFSVKPVSHWGGAKDAKGNCPLCSGNKFNTETYKQKLRSVIGEHFDFSEVVYVDPLTRIFLTCLIHNHRFSSFPANITRPGSKACRLCVGEIKKANYAVDVIERFQQVHGDRYDYSQVDYKGMLLVTTIICRKHGAFQMTPGNHLSDHGCSSCTNNAPSKQEDMWIDALTELIGIEPERALRLKGTSGAYDAAFKNVIVEFDGAYWHSLDGALAKDSRKTMIALDHGYSVVRIRANGGRHKKLVDIPLATNIHTHEKVNDEGLQELVDAVNTLIG